MTGKRNDAKDLPVPEGDQNATEPGKSEVTSGNVSSSDEESEDRDSCEESVHENLSPNTMPLTDSEIRLLRAQMRAGALKMHASPLPPWYNEEFRVPKTHPVFDGSPGKLEPFIMEMELEHQSWVMGPRADEHRPEFITKLGDYFKESTAARTWFQLYARERIQKNLPLSWHELVKGLRGAFGAQDRPDILYCKYWELQQGNSSVQDYITNKKQAALLCGENLLPIVAMWGFVRGLESDVQSYVNLQQINNLEDAQIAAIKFAESQSGPKKLITRSKSKKQDDVASERKRKFTARNKNPPSSVTQMEARENLKKLKFGKCFGCGSEGHMREKCDASEEAKKIYQQEINRLRRIAHTTQ
jgi:hypothetical protein